MTKDQQDLYDENIYIFMVAMRKVGGCPISLFYQYKEILKICSLNGVKFNLTIVDIEK